MNDTPIGVAGEGVPGPATMYDASAPVFQKMLTNLSRILDKAQAHAAERNVDPAVLLQGRLYPDMFPLVRQVQAACDQAKGAAARLAGLEPPRFADDEQTFDELQQRISRTLDFVAGAPAAAIAESAERKVVVKQRGGEVEFSGREYLFTYALPNFFFHVTTAYDILRHDGVDLGKRDYLG